MSGCPQCGKPWNDHLGVVGTCGLRQIAEDEVVRLREALTMVADAFVDWQEPEENATCREWCDRFNVYLRGCVVAQATFEPDEWRRLQEFRTPNPADHRPA